MRLIATLLISIFFLSPSVIALSQEEESAIRKQGLEAFNAATAVPLRGDRRKLVYQRYSIEFTPPKDFTVKEVKDPNSTAMLYLLEGKPRPSGSVETITAVVFPDDNISLEPQPELEVAALEDTLKPWKKSLSNYAESDQQITVGKNTARGKVFSGSLSGKELKGVVAATKINKGMWVFFTMNHAAEFAGAEKTLLEMLRNCELAGEKSKPMKLEAKAHTFTYGTHSLVMTPPEDYVVREIPLPFPGRIFAMVGPTRADKSKATLTVTELDGDDTVSVEEAVKNAVIQFKKDASNYAGEPVKVRLGNSEIGGMKFAGNVNGADRGGFALSKKVKGALWSFLLIDDRRHLSETEKAVRKALEQATVD